MFNTARQNPKAFDLTTTSLNPWTHLHEWQNLLEESDLGAKWACDVTRAKLTEWINRFAENDFPSMNEAIVQCLEEFEADASGAAEETIS